MYIYCIGFGEERWMWWVCRFCRKGFGHKFVSDNKELHTFLSEKELCSFCGCGIGENYNYDDGVRFVAVIEEEVE